MLDSRLRFTATAEQYHQYRPSYPPALIDWLIEATGRRPPARVADIGCGTGIATRLLAQRGFRVIGIDPSEGMLAYARGAGEAIYLRGEATTTGLRDHSVDLVTAAQSFHWFDVAPALHEFERILRPNGWCAAFWNLRASTPFMDEYDGLLRSYSSEYEIMLRQDRAAAELPRTVAPRACRETELANVQILDLSGLRGRAYSHSCVTHGVADLGAFDEALTRAFESHRREGRVEFRYRTLAFCWPGCAPDAKPL
jgi:SAM-dependent methyltransferase